MDVFSSTLAGIVIFSLLGYMALKLQVDIGTVVQSGKVYNVICMNSNMARIIDYISCEEPVVFQKKRVLIQKFYSIDFKTFFS